MSINVPGILNDKNQYFRRDAIVADINGRDLISNDFRYIGFTVLVLSENKEYRLMGGIENSDWVDVSTGITPSHTCNFSGVRQGIPTGTVFNGANECDILQAGFPSTNPNVSISLSPGTGLREFGDDVVNPQITASWTRGTNPVSDIVSVEFFRGTTGGTLINTDNSPNAGDSTSVFSDTFTIDRSSVKQYTIRITDGEGRSNTASRSYSFVDPYYFGVGATGLTPVQIQGLTKLIQTSGNKTTVTSPNAEVYYFAYPASYGTLSSIIDENNFDVTASYQLRVENFTALDGQTISYNIYEGLNITTQTNFSQTYNL